MPATAQGLVAPVNSLNSGEYFLIGDGARGAASLAGSTPYSSLPGSVRIWQFGQRELRKISLPFFPHSFAAHPNEPQRIITFEKWGRHLAEIDLATLRVLRVTEAAPGKRFFGHGVHAGAYIYATQMDDAVGRGIVAVLDSSDHHVVHEFDTHGIFPHDCQYLAGSDTLLIVNSRHHRDSDRANNFSSLVWMDAKTGHCLKQVFILSKAFGYAHLAQSQDGYKVLSGSHDLTKGGSQPILAVLHPDDTVQVLDVGAGAQEKLSGEILSLFVDDVEVTATLPNAGRIQVWNYRSGKFLRQYKMAEPRGLAYAPEQHKLLVSSALTKDLLRMDELQRVALGLGGNGSHLYQLKL